MKGIKTVGDTQSATYIAGIANTSISTGSPVVVSSSGQLGVSSGGGSFLGVSTDTPSTLVARDGTGSFAAATVTVDGNLTLSANDSSEGTGQVTIGGEQMLFLSKSEGTAPNVYIGTGVAPTVSALSYGGSVALGYEALGNWGGSSEEGMIAIGYQAGQNATGTNDIAIGSQAGTNTTGYNDIDIGNPGVGGDKNTLRIGTIGAETETAYPLSSVYIAGIYGEPVSSGVPVYVNSNGQLGVSSTPVSMTFLGAYGGISSTYVENDVVTSGGAQYVCTASACTGEALTNTSYWTESGLPNVLASTNLGAGASALGGIVGGTENTAFGQSALQADTSGGSNSAFGYDALDGVTTGSNNIGLGSSAGTNVTTGSSNIDIGNTGSSSDAATLRIGEPGTQAAAYIAGIYDTADTGTLEVCVASDGQLTSTSGTCGGSSIRFKTDVRDIGDDSDVLMSLRPVAFRYRPEYDPLGAQQYGLIAEEVEKVAPQLVEYDKDGQPANVKYNLVNALLLNTIQQQQASLTALQSENEHQQAEIASLQQGLQDRDAKLEALARRLDALEARVR